MLVYGNIVISRGIVVCSIHPYPIFREGKKFELIAAHDVTNKIQYREELHRLLEHCLDGIMLTRPDGQIHKVNKAARQILGMSDQQIINLGRDKLVHNDEKLKKALRKREQTGGDIYSKLRSKDSC